MFQLGSPLSNQKTQAKRGKKAALKIRCLTQRQIYTQIHTHTHTDTFISLRAGKPTHKKDTGRGRENGWVRGGWELAEDE